MSCSGGVWAAAAQAPAPKPSRHPRPARTTKMRRCQRRASATLTSSWPPREQMKGRTADSRPIWEPVKPCGWGGGARESGGRRRWAVARAASTHVAAAHAAVRLRLPQDRQIRNDEHDGGIVAARGGQEKGGGEGRRVRSCRPRKAAGGRRPASPPSQAPKAALGMNTLPIGLTRSRRSRAPCAAGRAARCRRPSRSAAARPPLAAAAGNRPDAPAGATCARRSG